MEKSVNKINIFGAKKAKFSRYQWNKTDGFISFRYGFQYRFITEIDINSVLIDSLSILHNYFVSIPEKYMIEKINPVEVYLKINEICHILLFFLLCYGTSENN